MSPPIPHANTSPERPSIGVLGSGVVGRVLAAGFARHGHTVTLGSRSPEKLNEWRANVGSTITLASFAEAAETSKVVILAVKGSAAKEALQLAKAENLAGKLVLDATNPIADAPPDNGVIRFFTGPNESLMERLQEAFPAARFVKAFSCVGNALMIDPDLPGGPPTMFIAGNDPAAKAEAAALLSEVGWETEDMGGAAGARAIEPLCILWCIPGLLRGTWRHAFKLLR